MLHQLNTCGLPMHACEIQRPEDACIFDISVENPIWGWIHKTNMKDTAEFPFIVYLLRFSEITIHHLYLTL
jgi:hypothetical protein